MNDNATRLIQELAQKLGTTSQYLWSVLLKQAPIDAAITLFQTIIVAILATILYRLHNKFSKKDSSGNTMYYDSDSLCVVMIISAVIIGTFGMICFYCFESVFNGFFNPEFWALDYILHLVRPIK